MIDFEELIITNEKIKTLIFIFYIMNQKALQNECWKACYHTGDLAFVKSCLAKGMDINARAEISGATPLDASIYGGHRPIFDYLILENANVNGIGYAGHTVLMAAVNQGYPDIVNILLEHGADPNLASPVTGETPLHIAALRGFAETSTESLILLLEAGANPNVKTKVNVVTESMAAGTTVIGETPLHWAAAFGSQKMIKLFLEAGADKFATDAHGETPLIWYGRHQRTSAHIMVERGTRDLLD